MCKDHMFNKALEIALIKTELPRQAHTHVTIDWAQISWHCCKDSRLCQARSKFKLFYHFSKKKK